MGESRNMATVFAQLPTDNCVLWPGGGDRCGYGVSSRRLDPPLAHRAVYEAVLGPIPPGLHLDHLCRVPLCVNPAHLEPVTQRENNYRSRRARQELDPNDFCQRGHPWDDKNTFWIKTWRECRACRGAATKRYEQRRQVRLGDIGPVRRRREFIPMPEKAPVPERVPEPAPAPERVPQPA